MANDDSFFLQGLPQEAIAQALQSHPSQDYETFAGHDSALRAKDDARVAKLHQGANAARAAAWAGRMNILNE